MNPIYAVIASGYVGSQAIDLRQSLGVRAIAVPLMTSGDLLLQGAMDSTSGSFARLIETRAPGSGDLRFATGPGSRWVALPSVFETLPPYLRLEASVQQTDTRTLTLLSR